MSYSLSESMPPFLAVLVELITVIVIVLFRDYFQHPPLH